MYKDPVTDHGKMSRKGRMTLELDSSGQYVTRTEGTGDPQKVCAVEESDLCTCSGNVQIMLLNFQPDSIHAYTANSSCKYQCTCTW